MVTPVKELVFLLRSVHLRSKQPCWKSNAFSGKLYGLGPPVRVQMRAMVTDAADGQVKMRQKRREIGKKAAQHIDP